MDSYGSSEAHTLRHGWDTAGAKAAPLEALPIYFAVRLGRYLSGAGRLPEPGLVAAYLNVMEALADLAAGHMGPSGVGLPSDKTYALVVVLHSVGETASAAFYLLACKKSTATLHCRAVDSAFRPSCSFVHAYKGTGSLTRSSALVLLSMAAACTVVVASKVEEPDVVLWHSNST